MWSTDDKTKIDTKKDTPEQVVDKVFDAAKEKAMDNDAPAIQQKKTAKNKGNRKKSHKTNKRMRRQRKRSRMILQVAVVVISTALMAYVGRSWIEKIKQNFIALTTHTPALHTHKKKPAPATSHTEKKPESPAKTKPAPVHSFFPTHHSLPDKVNKELENICNNFDRQRTLNINGKNVAGCGLHALNNALQPHSKITDNQIEIIVKRLLTQIEIFAKGLQNSMHGRDGLDMEVLIRYINDKYNTIFSATKLDNLRINEMHKYGAFIANTGAHWIAIRRIHKDYEYWVKIDSFDKDIFKNINTILNSANDVIWNTSAEVLNHFVSYVGGFAIEKNITHRS